MTRLTEKNPNVVIDSLKCTGSNGAARTQTHIAGMRATDTAESLAYLPTQRSGNQGADELESQGKARLFQTNR